MVFSFRRNTEKQQMLVNVQEAYSLWDILRARYASLDQLIVWQNFVHDQEFMVILEDYSDQVRKDIKDFEKLVVAYSIKAPRPPRKDINSSLNTEIISDELIGNWLFLISQEIIEMYLRAIRTAVTNDNVREFYIEKVKLAIDYLDNTVKYVKLKAWLDSPPIYPNIPVNTNESLDCGEVYHLWEHLSFRYANIEETQIYLSLSHDGDFRIVLKSGQSILRKQAKMLENECKFFGIPFPREGKQLYSNVGENTDMLDDKYMYLTLLDGMQAAAVLHAHALKQSVTNDRVRGIFKDLLLSEVNAANKFIKYGKTKCWPELPPQYKAVKG